LSSGVSFLSLSAQGLAVDIGEQRMHDGDD